MSTQLQTPKALFVHLISEISPEDWEKALLSLCPENEALRNETRSLLAAHLAEDSHLDRPDPEATLLPPQPQIMLDFDFPLIGQRIGPYKLLEKIGEGGMGIIYMAEQTEPVRRKVALKIIKPGMDTKEVIARFEAERQALALMDHPNIARVLGGGVTATTDSGYPGRPYFVMDLVYGTPLNKFCDQLQLGTRGRLELFLDVCRAVQHAHQKGVIHRDLKPSNVLVSMDDVRPVPKVIDFGVAKALSQQLTEKTLFTAYGQVIGTPMYMSPEQTQHSVQDIDTRSDIYSLGVILYELLTGCTPFDRETLRRSGYEGMRRQICEVDPPRPSFRFATLNAASKSTVADQRRVDPRRLHDSLKGELDWIVMKALEKDRNRRYDTVNDFAADIQRYLNNEPVHACPPSTAYRTYKFISRNKGLITTVSLILLALIAGLGVALWQAVRATQAEILAVREKDRALASEQENQILLYVADIQRAEDAWSDRDVSQLRRILESQIPNPLQRDLRGFEWHYLMRQQGQLRQVLFTGETPVYFLLPLPDGELAAAGADGMIRFLDLATGDVIRSINSGQGEVNGLALSPDGRLFASAGDDGTIAVRDFPSLKLKWQVKAHEQKAFQVAFTPDSRAVISVSSEPDAGVWETETGARRKLLDTDDVSLEGVSVSPQGRVLLGTNRGGVWLYDQNHECVYRSGDQFPQSVAEFSNAGHLFAEGHSNGVLIVRRSASPTEIPGRWHLPDAVSSIEFLNDDRSLVAGDASGAVHLLPIPAANLSDPNANARPFDSLRAEPTSWHAHDGPVYSITYHGERQSVITTGKDGTLVSWKLPGSEFRVPSFSDVSDVLFVNTEKTLWATSSELRLTSKDPGTVSGVASPTGWHLLAAAHSSGRICATQRDQPQIFEIDPENLNPKVIWSVDGNARYHALALSPDGETLVVATTLSSTEDPIRNPHQFLETVDLRNGRRLSRIPVGEVHNIKIAPDGSGFVYQVSNEIHLVAAPSWQIVRSFAGHSTSVNRIDWCPSAPVLASASSDRTLRLWSAETAEELWSTVAHRSSVRAVAFTPDGRTLATAGEDGYVRLWNWQSRRLALRIPIRVQSVKHLRFSPDSKQLIVIYFSGECDVIDAHPYE